MMEIMTMMTDATNFVKLRRAGLAEEDPASKPVHASLMLLQNVKYH